MKMSVTDYLSQLTSDQVVTAEDSINNCRKIYD